VTAVAPNTDKNTEPPWHGFAAPIPTSHQIPAVDAPAGLEHLLVGSLLWAVPDNTAGVFHLVADDDFADPHLGVVWAALRDMVIRGESHSPQLVMDELTRQGVHRPVLTALMDATTSGACTEACREYAAAVVAAALRRHTESGGVALTSAAADAAEIEIPVIAATITQRLNTTVHRLTQLRGDEL
jgi:hypothetical protein